MNTIPRLLLPFLTFALLAGAGSVTYRETKFTDVKRTHVLFASDRSARIFYETLSAMGDAGRKTEKHASTWFGLTSYDTCTVQGPNALFNEAVRACDTNADGQITEAEAEVYSRTSIGDRG